MWLDCFSEGARVMKRRNLAIIYLLILTIGTILSLYIPKHEAAKADAAVAVIPDEAIRLRILANSDREADQAVKRLIRDKVNHDITEWVAELTSIQEAREVIISHLDEIQATAENVMAKEGLNQSVKVDFGQAEFPTKLYGQYLYPAGDYEAVIITLGEGEGANWWCVLFPPLCFLDFSNGTAVSQSPVEEEGKSAEAAKQSNAPTNKVELAKRTEVIADKVEDDKQKEVAVNQVEEQTSQTEVEIEEDMTKSQQTEVEVNPVKDQLKNQTKEAAKGTEDPESDSKDQEEQINPEQKKEEMPKEEAVDKQKDIPNEQLYDGTEEPKIVKKSLFAEIFSKLF